MNGIGEKDKINMTSEKSPNNFLLVDKCSTIAVCGWSNFTIKYNIIPQTSHPIDAG